MIDPNAPAFPIHELNDDGSPYHQHFGLTIRQHYAGQVFVGLLACGNWQHLPIDALSEMSFKYADGFIAYQNEGRTEIA